MTKIISNNPFYLFYFTIHELMKPFSLCLMLAFILPNYILFMIYDFELQQALPDFHQLIKEKKSIDDFGERNDYIPNIQQNLENLEIIINKNTYINPDNEINQKYCQNSQCKFLFVYSNSEPETKTNVQFINTFAHLANKLNRTLVLTNVGTSRIDSCNKFPFEFYYNIDYLKEKFPNLSLISQDNFQFWTNERIEKPNFHYLHLSSSSSTSSTSSSSNSSNDVPIVEDIQLDNDGGDINCLKNFEMNYNNFNPYQKILFRSDLLLKSSYRKNISKFLISNLKNSNSEILLIKNEINKEIFPSHNNNNNNNNTTTTTTTTTTTLSNPYSDSINHETWKINVALEPFVAIYWKMIDINDSKILLDCAKKLINTLKILKENIHYNNIYLATDYPVSLDFIQSSSSSYSFSYRQTRHYRRAIHLLNTTMTINTWYSLNAFDKIIKRKENLEEFKGKGITNILDKLVCTSSDYFITAPSECTLKSSNNFIKDIINVREKLYYDYDNQKIQNIISKW
ncbi:hypothetical protein RhiirA4_509880 [Rhizophagus irregularis]|uniref:Uncharacterized protein n=1 Tax=Rhizophagus irregularis TaxID=588596 RepID=A0A2I1G2I2_9GLOM|nr:hypothetical protein RhiirA4_495913 [Rhizophagus irregularis]PKY57407.1 hypothetical protein RhiirA4_509880 [Rhizophagus irregularis]